MARSHTRNAFIACAAGAVAGVAFVIKADWITQLVGGASGGVVILMSYILCKLILGRWIHRSASADRRASNAKIWGDYDDRAYRVERMFMDDGKPW